MNSIQNEIYATDENGETYLVDQNGNVLDKKANSKKRLICGVGVNDWKFAVLSSEGGSAPAYGVWVHMLKRGYDEKLKSRYPTYMDASVCENWLSFTRFFNDTKTYIKQGYHLDKDLLFFNNKVYSKDTCIFVPNWLNTILLDCGNARGDLPQGVCFHKAAGKYVAQCRVDGKQKHLGLFTTVEEASDEYINFKLDYIESKRLNIEAIGIHNGLHLRFGSDFSFTDRIIENFKKQVFYLMKENISE